MSDYGLETIMPINTVFVRGPTAIIFESITKKMVTFHRGYCNSECKNITIHDYEHYTKKVFDEGNPEDGMRLYVKMGGVSKLYLDNFYLPDDDYTIE